MYLIISCDLIVISYSGNDDVPLADYDAKLCNICGKFYKARGSLAYHMQVVHKIGEPKYICNTEGCNKKFYYELQFKAHVLKHQGVS